MCARLGALKYTPLRRALVTKAPEVRGCYLAQMNTPLSKDPCPRLILVFILCNTTTGVDIIAFNHNCYSHLQEKG